MTPEQLDLTRQQFLDCMAMGMMLAINGVPAWEAARIIPTGMVVQEP